MCLISKPHHHISHLKPFIIGFFVVFFAISSSYAVTPNIATGGAVSLILEKDGSLWRYDDFPDENDALKRYIPRLVQIGTQRNWSAVFTGFCRSYAINNNGELKMFDGFEGNFNGKDIGIGKEWRQISEQTVDFRFSLSSDRRCPYVVGIDKDEHLWAWNYNEEAPVSIQSDMKWNSISLNTLIKDDGTLWALNINSISGNTIDFSLTQIGSESDWTKISSSGSHTLALKSDNSLWAWGDNSNYQLGDGSDLPQTTPIPIGSSKDWIDIAAGALNLDITMEEYCTTRSSYGYSLAIKENGSLWSWGSNLYGQTGIFTNLNSATYSCTYVVAEPTQVGNSMDWVAVTTSSGFSIAQGSHGKLWEFGNVHLFFEGSSFSKYNLIKVDSDTAWTSVESFPGFTKAIARDGSIWGWGVIPDSPNDVSSTSSIYQSPIELNAVPDYPSRPLPIYGSETNPFGWDLYIRTHYYSLATKNGELGVWMNDGTYQKYDPFSGNEPEYIFPGVNQLAIDDESAAVIDQDGFLWMVGTNVFSDIGSLSDDSFVRKMSPDNDWVYIEVGDFRSSFAIKENGEMYAWGNNINGVLGIGESTFVPKTINRAPVILSQPDIINIRDIDTYSYSPIIEDSDSSEVQISFNDLPVWLTWDHEKRLLNGSPSRRDGGKYVFLMKASDERATAQQEIHINVTVHNSIPEDILFSNSAVNENIDTSTNYKIATLSALDKDTKEEHSFEIIGGKDGETFTILGSSLYLNAGVTVDYEKQNKYELDISVSDMFGDSFTKPIEIEVININEAPNISTVEDIVIDEAQDFAEIEFTLSDIDTPMSELNVSVETNKPDTIPETFLILSGDGANRVLRINRSSIIEGDTQITISVNDGELTHNTIFNVSMKKSDNPQVEDVVIQEIVNNESSTTSKKEDSTWFSSMNIIWILLLLFMRGITSIIKKFDIFSSDLKLTH